jgi:hypothetical protein
MKLHFKCCLSMALLVLSSTPAFSAELANLRNGFAIRTDHHEARGEFTRLFMSDAPGNFVDIPSDQIVGFEALPEPPPDPPAAPTPAPVVPAARKPSLDEIVTSASTRYGIDRDLVLSLIHAESAFDPNAVSPKGALGLMQLMPQTATRLGVQNPMDAADNVEGGTRYLRDLLLQYNQNLTKALAAYNAGPGRIQQYRGVPPYPETIAYINRVVRELYQRKIASVNLLYKKSDKSKKEPASKPSRAAAPARPREMADRRSVDPASAPVTLTP